MDVVLCHCLRILGRKIQLLGIAHPVVGPPLQVLEVHLGWDTSEALEAKKWPNLALFYVFCKSWVEDPVLGNL